MIEWTAQADGDAEALFDHIAKDDFQTAANVITRVIAATNRLDQFPKIGRPGRVPGTRELILPKQPYVVIYRHDKEKVTILRLLHTAMRWPA